MWKFICITVMIIGIVVSVSSFPPAWAEVVGAQAQEHVQITDTGLSQAFQIKLLIGIVIVLFGGNMWWTRRYITKQEERDALLVADLKVTNKNVAGISRSLATLKGEHDMSQQIRGCAADPSVLETSIRDAVKNALQPLFDYHLHQREK